MEERKKQYPFDKIEPKWQRVWEETEAFRALNPGDPGFDSRKPKYYILDMFPYPSGDGLHVGHTEGYTATDILARYKRLRGYNVLHPMGWDAFGLPAEQYAIRTGEHPRVTTQKNIDNFRKQLKRVGFSYDWSREVNTTDPEYFKWTQWIFLRLYNSWFDPEANAARPISELCAKRRAEAPHESEQELRAFLDAHRLAYVAEMPVNWCPELGTVLANEEVVDGRSEVGGFAVERRPMRQWMLRITAYAERLIEELDLVDWPESIKTLQRNWIGRSEGAIVRFTARLTQSAKQPEIEVFTTRPDTLFGATYIVLSPEHPLVQTITTSDQRDAVESYRASIASKSDLERTDLAKEKTGVFTGAYAVNPLNKEEIPIWIADYVLMTYGTGAIMAVPAHDERDYAFAVKFELPIREVVRSDTAVQGCFSGSGTAINSSFLNGLRTEQAFERVIEWLEENGFGRRKVNYKLRDWLFSRQRYWGEPFPIVWSESGHEPLPDEALPLLPPELSDFKPTGSGEPPLARASDWVQTQDQKRRETNTMPQWAGSCWYYLRYCDPKNTRLPIGPEADKYWMNVDLYVGGTEHAVLHLLYARFWHKVLFDLNLVSTREPFQRLVNQGIILGEDNQKMSKTRGNVVNPDFVIDKFGADSLRLYEMFMGPLTQQKPWSMTGVEGVYRFLARVWRLAMEENQEGNWQLSAALAEVPPSSSQLRVIHATIKKVTQDTEALAFNTAISQMMVFVNEFTGATPRPVSALRTLCILLHPYAPHLTEELWELLAAKFPGFEGHCSSQTWPTWQDELLVEDNVEYVIQINGKLRDKLLMTKDAPRDQVEAAALNLPKVVESLAGRPPAKVIVVPNKLVNVVVPATA